MRQSLRCHPHSLAGSQETLSWQGRGHSSTRMEELEAAGHQLGWGRAQPMPAARTSLIESKRQLMVGMEGLWD